MNPSNNDNDIARMGDWEGDTWKVYLQEARTILAQMLAQGLPNPVLGVWLMVPTR
jgi:hypothetical protein